MIYLIAQMIFWLVAAALIGLVVGWLLRRASADELASQIRIAAARELDAERAKVRALKTDLDRAASSRRRVDSELVEARAELARLQAQLPRPASQRDPGGGRESS